MFVIPYIYLKGGKAVHPIDARPSWFQDNALELAKALASQGAELLYINDLNVPTTGRSENFSAIQSIQKNLNLKLWVTGNFKSIAAMEPYADLGAEKIVLGGSAYQNPNLLKEALNRFFKKIAVLIEVKNKRVVIPGMVTPSHKTAFDYASQFEKNGVAAFCYADDNIQALQDFCNHAKAPVVTLCEIPVMQDLEKLFECESSGLFGVVLNKPLYENRIDLHGAIAFLNDLAAKTTTEATLTPD